MSYKGPGVYTKNGCQLAELDKVSLFKFISKLGYKIAYNENDYSDVVQSKEHIEKKNERLKG